MLEDESFDFYNSKVPCVEIGEEGDSFIIITLRSTLSQHFVIK